MACQHAGGQRFCGASGARSAYAQRHKNFDRQAVSSGATPGRARRVRALLPLICNHRLLLAHPVPRRARETGLAPRAADTSRVAPSDGPSGPDDSQEMARLSRPGQHPLCRALAYRATAQDMMRPRDGQRWREIEHLRRPRQPDPPSVPPSCTHRALLPRRAARRAPRPVRARTDVCTGKLPPCTAPQARGARRRAAKPVLVTFGCSSSVLVFTVHTKSKTSSYGTGEKAAGFRWRRGPRAFCASSRSAPSTS